MIADSYIVCELWLDIIVTPISRHNMTQRSYPVTYSTLTFCDFSVFLFFYFFSLIIQNDVRLFICVVRNKRPHHIFWDEKSLPFLVVIQPWEHEYKRLHPESIPFYYLVYIFSRGIKVRYELCCLYTSIIYIQFK